MATPSRWTAVNILTLAGDTLYGVTLSGGTDAIGSGGIEVSGSSEIDNATIDGNGHTITVDSGQTLTLDTVALADVTLSGGTDALSAG